MLENTLESNLDCKEIKTVNPKGNQSCIFFGRTDAEAEIPIFWPPLAKNWFSRKDPDAGKDWRQEEKGTTENGMIEWHHQLDGHEFEQALEVGEGMIGKAGELQSMGWKSQALLSNWTELGKKESVLSIHWKDWCWRWSSITLANWCKELTLWGRPWCWERLKAGDLFK